MRALPWLPPLAWMCLILWLGSDTGSAERTGHLILPVLRVLLPFASAPELDAVHALLRKLGHVTEYGVLAVLWSRALVTHGMVARRAAWSAWLVTGVWAVVDEITQTTIASRTGSALDVALDAASALVVALAIGHGWRRLVDVVARGALWTAAVGGVALIALNLATGVRSGALWLAVPLALVALGLLRVRP
jgi:VanZ family protein